MRFRFIIIIIIIKEEGVKFERIKALPLNVQIVCKTPMNV